MKDLEWFRKQTKEHDREIIRLSENLDKLRRDKDKLEEQIDTAINASDFDTVDRLTEQMSTQDNKIRTAEKILERRKLTSVFPKEDIISANNAEMRKYQSRVDDLMQTADKYRRLYFETLIQAGEVVQQANGIRNEYMRISTDEPISLDEIGSVHGGLRRPPLRASEAEYVNSIKPGAFSLIGFLRL